MIEDKLYCNICDLNILAPFVEPHNIQQDKLKVDSHVIKDNCKLSQLLFSEYFKGIIFILFVLVISVFIPKCFFEKNKIVKIISQKIIRVIDFMLAIICFICLAPLWILISFLISSIPHTHILLKEHWIGENRRLNQRRILQFVQQRNVRVSDRRQIKLSGRVLELYSFNCFELMNYCNSEVLKIVLLQIRRIELDKLPRLINIIRGDISMLAVNAIHPLNAGIKKMISGRLKT